MKINKLWRNWPVHNLVAHPISELVHWITFPFFGDKVSGWIHDSTAPIGESDENTIPKHATKHIIWHDNSSPDKTTGAAIILVGYCPDTLGYFNRLFNEVKKTFPSVKEDEAICSKVKKSPCVQGFTMIKVPVYEKRSEVEGYTVAKSTQDLYIEAF